MHTHPDNMSVDAGFDALDYNYADYKIYDCYTNIRGERHLWCAVIHQAFIDLEDEMESAEARRWLLRDKRDFVLACSLAGFSPLTVRMAALERVEILAKIKREPVI